MSVLVKTLALAGFVGTLCAHWLAPLTAATIACAVVFASMRLGE